MNAHSEQSDLVVHAIRKSFPGVTALNLGEDRSIAFGSGEIHALLGENGAGKSTLVSIIAGNQSPTSGSMLLGGRTYAPANVAQARAAGVEVVLQELGLIRGLSVADNLFLGREHLYTTGRLLSHGRKRRLAEQALAAVGETVPVDVQAGDLSLEQQKFVELARALSFSPQVLVVDEMTASLTQSGVRRLIDLLRRLRDDGMAIIYISHYLEEIFELCDTVTVLKDGQLVRTMPVAETDPDSLSVLMVGRETRANMYPAPRTIEADAGSNVLRLENLTLSDRYRNVSLHVERGEVLGIGGLLGCGSEDLLLSIFGALKPDGGQVFLDEAPARIASPRGAIDSRIAYVPKDREHAGIILRSTIQDNIALPSLRYTGRFGLTADRAIEPIARELIARLLIACRSPHEQPINLSGGNRQKIVLAKWMTRPQKVLMLSNPTRGIDVGAKAEIYALIRKLANEGLGVILVSDELQELIGMSDRLLVMRRGEVTATFTRQDWPTEETLITHML